MRESHSFSVRWLATKSRCSLSSGYATSTNEVPMDTIGIANVNSGFSKNTITKPVIITNTSSIRTQSIKISNFIHLFKQVKQHTFMIWMKLSIAPKISGKSGATYDSSSESLSKTGFFKIVTTPIIATRIANTHTKIRRELNALTFRLPIQLLRRVQWWS